MNTDAKPLEAAEIAALLAEFGDRLELGGESAFKVRAYHRAADSLRALPVPIADVIAHGRLRAIPGVGEAIAEKIERMHRTGSHPSLERLRQDVPAGVLEMLAIPGLKADTVRRLHQELGIDSLDALETACRDGVLAEVKGFGPALQTKIVQGLELARQRQGRHLLHRARDLLDHAAAALTEARPDLARIVPAGDYRRGGEVVADLALVAEGIAPAPEAPGDGARVRVAEPERYGAALLFATGSQEHLRQLTAYAAERGFTLDETGLRRGRKSLPCPTEEAIYAALGLAFIPPELREGGDEIARAAAGTLPRLVEDADIRGVLHSHTELSDGNAPLAAMAQAARQRGYLYYGVTDHSQTAAYAGGLKPDEIAAQQEEADALNTEYRGAFRIFKGIESDILADGALDYPESVLAGFDFVVASVHGRFGLDEPAQTARILRAVANPYTTILGHLTGRLLLSRKGYDVDIPEILKACAEHGVAVEINGNPHRLDLDWRWHQMALELGCTMSINADAHSTAELDLTHWGVIVARKGGVPADRVLNTLGTAQLAEHFAARKAKAAPKRRRAKKAAAE